MSLKTSEMFLDFLKKFDENQSMESNIERFDIAKLEKMLNLEHSILISQKSNVNKTINTLEFFVKLRLYLFEKEQILSEILPYSQIKKLLSEQQKKQLFAMNFHNFQKYSNHKTAVKCLEQMVDKNEEQFFLERFKIFFYELNQKNENAFLTNLSIVKNYLNDIVKRLFSFEALQEIENIKKIFDESLVERKSLIVFDYQLMKLKQSNQILELFADAFINNKEKKIKHDDNILKYTFEKKNIYSEKIEFMQITHMKKNKHAVIISEQYAQEFESMLKKFIENLPKNILNMSDVQIFLDEFFINQKLTNDEHIKVIKKYSKI